MKHSTVLALGLILLVAGEGTAWVAEDCAVTTLQKITENSGGFLGDLDTADSFGASVTFLGDLDGDGVGDIAVGSSWDDDGGPDRGAVWILFLMEDGSVKSHQKISQTEGDFAGSLSNACRFGGGVASLGDLDGDGVIDLAVAAHRDNDGGTNSGAVWILFLRADGTVHSHQKVSQTEGGFTGSLDPSDVFGTSIAAIGDIDGDGLTELAVGALGDDDGGSGRGAVWILFLNSDGTVKSNPKISSTNGNFIGQLDNDDAFTIVSSLGDLDHDGINDLAVGAFADDDGGFGRGAVWILFLNTDGTVKGHQKISDTEGEFSGTLNNGDVFGSSLGNLGDIDGDGNTDLAVTALWDDDGGTEGGAIWILYLNDDGTVKAHQKLSDQDEGFPQNLTGDFFGNSPALLGDLDGDGAVELAVGAPQDDDAGSRKGAVWVLALGGCLTPADLAPIADAGIDFSVNEGQLSVLLDGSASSDPDNDLLMYAWAQIPGGTTVTLLGADTPQATFDAPVVAVGGETLSFMLTVTANGKASTATVSVTVVNVNHPPVAEAGLDQSVAEGALVVLDGDASFDIDNDDFSQVWVQVGGSPTVTLFGATSANPYFVAPIVGTGGAPGIVATIVLQLTVDDGFPPDAPAPGYSLANVADTVTVEITNVNNDPFAAAGSDQTVDENTLVLLDGTASNDPDSDTVMHTWTQIGGSPVSLADPFAAMPSFITPFVNTGGEDLTFELTVDDSFGGSATDTVVVHVQNINDPPLASAAEPSIALLWPPNHHFVSVGIVGVTDPNNNASITIDSVTQDEPTNGQGDGDTAIDAIINPDGTVLLRAERSGNGDGRVYHIHFTASDLEGSSSGVVTVSVPRNKKNVAIDGGELYDSTN